MPLDFTVQTSRLVDEVYYESEAPWPICAG